MSKEYVANVNYYSLTIQFGKPANPSAFWASVSGGLYVLLGLGCRIWFG